MCVCVSKGEGRGKEGTEGEKERKNGEKGRVGVRKEGTEKDGQVLPTLTLSNAISGEIIGGKLPCGVSI